MASAVGQKVQGHEQPGKKYISRRAVLDRFGIGNSTLTRWLDAGLLSEPLVVAGRHFFDAEKLAADEKRLQGEFHRQRLLGPRSAPHLFPARSPAAQK